jgi:hypothetical protein
MCEKEIRNYHFSKVPHLLPIQIVNKIKLDVKNVTTERFKFKEY